MSKKMPMVVLISGNGSNLQAIIDAMSTDFPAEIKAVISNNTEAKGLKRAQKAGINTHTLSHLDFQNRESYDKALSKIIDQYSAELVVLAGFMRILSHWFVDHYQGQLLNIHPSLLPKFKGLNTHQQAIDAQESIHGATVHFVTAELDGGPRILQAQVPIKDTDDERSLAQRVLNKEHIIYPMVIEWIALGKVKLLNGQVLLNNKTLTQPKIL